MSQLKTTPEKYVRGCPHTFGDIVYLKIHRLELDFFSCLQRQLIRREEGGEWARQWRLNNGVLEQYYYKNQTVNDKRAESSDNVSLPFNTKCENWQF